MGEPRSRQAWSEPFKAFETFLLGLVGETTTVEDLQGWFYKVILEGSFNSKLELCRLRVPHTEFSLTDFNNALVLHCVVIV